LEVDKERDHNDDGVNSEHDVERATLDPYGRLRCWKPRRLDRVARRLRGSEQTVQIRIARELVGRCRNLTRTILALDRDLQARIEKTAPA